MSETPKESVRFCNCPETSYEDSHGQAIRMPIAKHPGAVHSCAYTHARSNLIPAAEAEADKSANEQVPIRYILRPNRKKKQSEYIENPAWVSAWQRAFCAYMDYHGMRVMRSIKNP